MARRRSPPTVAPGSILRHLDAEEVELYLSKWLQAYGANRHGVNAKAYIWHIFSAERYPALDGSDALAEYSRHNAPEYVVFSNTRDEAFETDVRPESSSLSDFLVFPRNLAWTMAFTHEDGWLGPYFAKNKSYAILEAENERRLKKAVEAENAKTKGWV